MSDHSATPRENWLHGHCTKAGRVGAPFDSGLTLPAEMVIEREEGLAVLDLQLDRERQQVSGVPNKAGEFEILLHGISSRDKKPMTVVLTLNVNPDPSTLWKDIASDPDGPFARPDVWHTALLSNDGISSVAASRRGRRHAHKGAYRDDAASLRYCKETGWHIVAVADGAGSASLSRRGAEIAVTTMTTLLPERLAELPDSDFESGNMALCECLVSTATEASRTIEEDAMFSAHRVEEFSTTLIVSAIKREGDQWLCVSFSIGDGGCVIWDAEASQVIPMSLADSGEFAGETRFLDTRILSDTDKCLDRLFVRRVDSFTALFLMSDGVSDPWFETEAALQDAEKWKSFWSEQLEPIFTANAGNTSERLLKWLDFFIQGEHDDRTIAALVPDMSEPAGKSDTETDPCKP